MKLLSCVWLFETPWTTAYQAPLSMGFSRQEYWSGVPSPSLNNQPNNILKSRDIIFLARVHLVKAVVFPVVMYGEGNGTPLQYSCLENPIDRAAWWAALHGVSKSQTQLSDFTFTFHFYALEKKVAIHSSVLAWRIPGMGSHRVEHDWSDLAVAAVS